ncbi:MAG: glycosyltransferase, partial [Alphaproteobacteria bacterium]
MLFLNHAAIVGGSEIDLVDLARHRGQGSSVLLFSDGPLVGMLRRADVPVEVLPTRWASAGRRARTTRPTTASLVEISRLVARVAKLARRHDVIFANSQKSLLVATLATPLARRPVVTMLHELLVPAHFSALNVRLNVALANRARVVIANSHATAVTLREAGGRPDRLAVVSPGFDPGLFENAPSDTASARHALGLPEGFLVGHFGRVTPWKGQHVLVEALA